MRLFLLLLRLVASDAASSNCGDIVTCSAVDAPPAANAQLQKSAFKVTAATMTIVDEGEEGLDLNAGYEANALVNDSVEVNASANESSVAQTFSAIQQRSARTRLHSAVQNLAMAVQEMDATWHKSDAEITGVLGKLGQKMSNSEDACSTNLVAYKKKLKRVHKEVKKMYTQVHSTESSSEVYGKGCKEKKGEIYVIEKENRKRIRKCKIQRKVEIRTLKVMKKEMHQLKKVSKAKIGYRQKRRGSNRPIYGGGDVRLLEVNGSAEEAPLESDDAEVNGVRSMVQRTKAAAQKVQQCLAQSELHSQHSASLLDETTAKADSEFQDDAEAALAKIAAVAEDGEYEENDEYDMGDVAARVELAMADNSSFLGNDTELEAGHPRLPPKVRACQGQRRGQRCYFAKPVRGPARFRKVLGVCMGQKHGTLTCRKAKVPSACRRIVVELKKEYAKSFKSITRLVEQYKKITHSKVCWETAHQEYESQSSAVQVEANKYCEREQKAYSSLTTYNAQYKRTIRIERKLKKTYLVTKRQCGGLLKTEQYVSSVKKTIKALGKCPGLGSVHFSVPKWVGTYAYFTQRRDRKDKWNDRKMRKKCQVKFRRRGIRPAEVAELDSRTVRKMPRRNTADAPVLGACPNCQGKSNGALSKGGHGRLCWDPKKKFNRKSRRGDCNSGRRAIICVLEKGYGGRRRRKHGNRRRRKVYKDKYNCLTREQWTPKKRHWCCKHKKRGCPEATNDNAMTQVEHAGP